jgi:hypothetical protein
MSFECWPALVFGWAGPILAIIFSVTGIIRAKGAWLVAAAVVLLPFSFYLTLNPGARWGIWLPLLPLIAARATWRGHTLIAWLSVLLLTVPILWIARLVVIARLEHW